MPFLEVHDDTEDSLCERVRPEYSAFDGYNMKEAIEGAAERWRGHAKEIWLFEGTKPPQGQKYHDMKPYKIIQI